MRSDILTFIQAISSETLGSFRVSTNLPWEDNGAPLYHHNKKHIYVDTDNTVQAGVFDALNGAGAVEETITVRVYFVTDAKQLPSNYDDLVEAIKLARLVNPTGGFVQRLVQVQNTYNADAILTTFDFSFKKLLTN